MGKTLSVLELARRAGVNYNTAYRWSWFGLIPAERVKGRWRIEAAQAQRFIETRAQRLETRP